MTKVSSDYWLGEATKALDKAMGRWDEFDWVPEEKRVRLACLRAYELGLRNASRMAETAK